MNKDAVLDIRSSSFITGDAKRLLIDGRWVEAQSGKTFESVNPSTGKTLDLLALAGEADVDYAVAAARRAFEGPWSKFKPSDRQAVLLKLADLIEQNYDDLALLDSLEMGMPQIFSEYVKDLVIGTFRFCAGQAVALHGETLPNSVSGDVFSYTLREPVGVVGAIIPWNGPILSAAWKIAPVLATGCTLVLKSAEQASLSPLRIGELCLEAGVPPGVINILTGYGAGAGAALARHLDVDKIAFTGSTKTGQEIIRASAGNIKRLSLELGGKSPNIVFADANLDDAVPGAAMAVFANSGQVCCAGTRLLVERAIYEEFAHRVSEFGGGLRVGDPLDARTQIGPLVSEAQLERVTGYISAGIEEGAKAMCGGERLKGDDYDAGYFVPPTVFMDVDNSMRVAREEIFGPVISVIPFDDIENALDIANDTVFGLGSGIWTENMKTAHRVARGIRSGSVWVNCYQLVDPAVPFGGYKRSGYGSEAGSLQLDGYLNNKTVWINT